MKRNSLALRFESGISGKVNLLDLYLRNTAGGMVSAFRVSTCSDVLTGPAATTSRPTMHARKDVHAQPPIYYGDSGIHSAGGLAFINSTVRRWDQNRARAGPAALIFCTDPETILGIFEQIFH